MPRLLLTLFCISLSAMAFAAAPIKPETVGTADELVAEAKTKAAEVEGFLASEDSFKENSKTLKQSASLLAVLGQALTEHTGESALKKSGPDLRDASMTIARAKTFADAQAALPKLQSAMKGETSGAVAEFDWAKLIRMHPLMEEMNARATQMRRVLKRPKDPATDSSHVMAISLLAITAHADTHEVKNPADLPKWYEMATELHDHMAKSAAAVRAKDTAAAQEHFTAGMQTCSKCHEQFKK